MRQIAIVLLAALASGLCAFWLVQRRHSTSISALAGTSGDDLRWIRTEFQLDDAQFAAVRRLHEDYAPICSRHCADIASAQTRLQELTTSGAPADRLEAARRELAALETVCNDATRAHIRRVAAVMSPEQGARYLALIEPHLARSPHDGSRGTAP